MRAVKTVATALVEAGFAVAAFDYRVVFRGGRLDEAIEDAHAAMRWWRSQADEFGLDEESVSVLGVSAGAAIAMAAATGLGPLDRLAGVYGPYDFLNLPTRARRIIGRVLLRSWDQGDWERRSPARTCDLPVPVALLHGLDDRLVSVEHTHTFADYRRERGLPVRVHLYEGARHGFLRHPDLPVTQRALDDLLGFFGRSPDKLDIL